MRNVNFSEFQDFYKFSKKRANKMTETEVPAIPISSGEIKAPVKQAATVRNPRNTKSNTLKTGRRAQSARPSPQRSAYQKALIQARLYAGCNFGKDAKKITIGCSRRDPRPSQAIPGPGAYNPPAQPLSHRLRTGISNYLPEKNFATLTSELDFRQERIFPESVHSIRVGERDNYRDWWILNHNPASFYVEKSNVAGGRTHMIQSRHGEAKKDTTPGPGSYEALKSFKMVNDFTKSTHLVMGNERRGHWMVREHNPSPADYSPNKNNILVHEPSYTIGNRSRPNKRREMSRKRNGLPTQSNRPQAMIGIDVFVIKLDPSIDENEARDYVRSHPDLKTVLHEVIEEILDTKPDAPVGFMRDYFIELKKEMGIEDPEPQEDPLDYYRNLISNEK